MSENEIKELVKRRGSIKARLTNFTNFMLKIQADHTAGNEIQDFEKIQLKDRYLKLQNLLEDTFEPIQIQIELLIAETDEAQQLIERSLFENNYYDVMAKAKLLIDKLGIIDSGDNMSHVSVEGSVANSGSGISNTSNNAYFSTGRIKLPDIKLPTFSGAHEGWLEFRDLFTSLINENADINDIQKFHYLRASLEGNAAQIIKSLEFSANNYKTAWDLVCKRYENKKLLVHNHVEALFNFGKLDRNTVSAANLRKLIDTVKKHLRALESLELHTNHWDILVIHLITESLDDGSVAKWEEYKFIKDVPSLEDMFNFLKNRADLLERLELNKFEKGHLSNQKIKGRSLFAATEGQGQREYSKKCAVCSGEHLVYECAKFQSLPVVKRCEQARNLKLCTKCLRTGHFMKGCKLFGSCKICKSKRHNTLLHNNETSGTNDSSTSEVNHTGVGATTCCSSINYNQTLLSTAVITVLSKNGIEFPVRAVLDSGSQSSYATKALCDKLQLDKERVEMMVAGINNSVSSVKHKCTLDISSQYSNFKSRLACFVVPEITGDLPIVPINLKFLPIPNVKLADEHFYKPGPVDVLIGADLFWNILCSGQYSLGVSKPIVQETLFGWIVSGNISGIKNYNKTYCTFSKNMENIEVQDQLAKFFEVEQVPTKGKWSAEEIQCEAHFMENTKRLPSGRFQVSIPLKEKPSSLGFSLEQAKNRFFAIERKLKRNEAFKSRYVDFLKQYEELGHMKRSTLCNESVNYLPHHGVFKEHSTSTKLRVVFDASAQTSNGTSLNDLQMKGPVVQEDLLSILLRFRQHRYVVTADIEKMYRQIMVSPDQCNLQNILWRNNSNEELAAFELLTVTFGMTSSPFLATRCLVQLSKDCQSSKPEISEIIARDFYVDDLLTGFDDIELAKGSCVEIENELKSGCFPLRKWRTNEPEVFENLKILHSADQSEELSFDNDDVSKTLGLVWSSNSDILTYKIHVAQERYITKRVILSSISRLYDPLGLLSPCVILAKVLLQKLWQENLMWDTVVPKNLQILWIQFMNQLVFLNNLKISRHAISINPLRTELHAFSDASETAYGACVYIRSISYNGEIISHLLCSKAKVAPLKSLTIPRLELCAAHVLSKLVNKVRTSLTVHFDKVFFWTDSQIILGWINTSTNLLKPFVRNRVAEIQELTEVSNWQYVPSSENPADLLSRGVNPQDIISLKFWWHGPDWLIKDEGHWPNRQKISTGEAVELPELKSVSLMARQNTLSFPYDRFSNLSRMIRCMAFILRFKNNCLSNKANRLFGVLTSKELDNAFKILLKIAQSNSFSDEYVMLVAKGELDKKSNILNLTPFMDEFGILRVGGRLKNSEFSYDKRHPMILSPKHRLTKLIMKAEHVRLMHAGPQQTLFGTRERFWVISGRNLAKAVVHQCVKCYRFRSKPFQPMMGNLPKERFIAGFPFLITGIDYAGPFQVLNKRGRGAKLIKSYVCLFVCFATKAIHLELVSDLSTDTFLLALKRFISRRGKPTQLFSDNGSNFVCANRQLNEVKQFFDKNEKALNDFVNNEGIRWHFSPAYSPHFGGLWEAGVKVVKHHLRRILGNSHCTSEEFITLLCQIEAILNSRPLSPLSNDPLDLIPLTPSHFLVGRTMSSVLEAELSHLQENRLGRYQRLEQLRQHWWKRWHKEFISELQQRTKWKVNRGCVKVGSLVIIKDNKLPPLNWLLGRVTKTFPGTDGVTRVFELYTSNGTITRDFTKICPLPEQEI